MRKLLVNCLIISFAFLSISSCAFAASVWTTDELGNTKIDFAPEDTVYITGDGFVPNLVIVLSILRPDLSFDTCPYGIRCDSSPVTDENGSFSLYPYVLEGIAGEYTITASDGTNSVRVKFTDAVCSNVLCSSHADCTDRCIGNYWYATGSCPTMMGCSNPLRCRYQSMKCADSDSSDNFPNQSGLVRECGASCDQNTECECVGPKWDQNAACSSNTCSCKYSTNAICSAGKCGASCGVDGDCSPVESCNHETCQCESTGPICGNGIVDGDEQCDGSDVDGCSPGDVCNINCQCYTPVCGDGIVDGDEQCDGGDCCNDDCTFKSTTTECRSADVPCDLAEYCTGTDSSCPSDAVQSNGYVCAYETGQCDANDICDGVTKNCNEVYASQGTTCNDGLFCTIGDNCDGNGNCVYSSPFDCSSDTLPEIDKCTNSPDGNPFTLDYAPAFTSICDEDMDFCTDGRTGREILSVCSKSRCNAECESTSDCSGNTCSETYSDYCTGKVLYEYDSDKIIDSIIVTDSCSNNCVDCSCTDCQVSCPAPAINSYCVKGICDAECGVSGDCSSKCDANIYYSGGTCTEGCECSYTTENCDLKDGWYDSTYENGTIITQWVPGLEECSLIEQKEEEYRDYSCSEVEGCKYQITNHHWVETGNTKTGSSSPEVCDGIDNNCNSQIDENDHMAPVTMSNAPLDWVNYDVDIELSANDYPTETGNCGVSETYYCTSDVICSPDIKYQSPFKITSEGITNVFYYSKDNFVGNIEETKSNSVKIDKSAPLASIIIDDAKSSDCSFWFQWWIDSGAVSYDVVHGCSKITASLDDQLSGIKSYNLKLVDSNNNVIRQYENHEIDFNFETSESVYKIILEAYDNAGNYVTVSRTVYEDDDNDVAIMNGNGGSPDLFDLCPAQIPTIDENKDGCQDMDGLSISSASWCIDAYTGRASSSVNPTTSLTQIGSSFVKGRKTWYNMESTINGGVETSYDMNIVDKQGQSKNEIHCSIDASSITTSSGTHLSYENKDNANLIYKDIKGVLKVKESYQTHELSDGSKIRATMKYDENKDVSRLYLVYDNNENNKVCNKNTDMVRDTCKDSCGKNKQCLKSCDDQLKISKDLCRESNHYQIKKEYAGFKTLSIYDIMKIVGYE